MRVPSPAFVISVIALFVALGGTSYAVTQLPKNSVGTKQLKKSAVTSQKIKDGTIATADLAAATRAALTGQKGETGATGATGAPGAQGPPGPSVGAAATTAPGSVIGTGPFASLLSLGTTATSTSSGPVVVTTPSRLQISASLNVQKLAADQAVEAIVRCTVQWSAAGSGTWLDTQSVSYGIVKLGTSSASGADAVVWGTISIEASETVNAGSYDVRLFCNASGVGSAVLDYAAINVVAIPEA